MIKLVITSVVIILFSSCATVKKTSDNYLQNEEWAINEDMPSAGWGTTYLLYSDGTFTASFTYSWGSYRVVELKGKYFFEPTTNELFLKYDGKLKKRDVNIKKPVREVIKLIPIPDERKYLIQTFNNWKIKKGKYISLGPPDPKNEDLFTQNNLLKNVTTTFTRQKISDKKPLKMHH